MAAEPDGSRADAFRGQEVDSRGNAGSALAIICPSVPTNSARARRPAASGIAICFAGLAAFSSLCFSQTAPRVPRFSDYPFDQWAAGPEHSGIKWQVHLLPTQLSVHQRLLERVQAVVPGRELERRRGRGELVLLVRFEDSDSRQWRTGSRLSLAGVQAGVKSDELTFTVAAFVRPGDYKVLIALIDTHTMEHSFTRRTLRVAPLKADPLPQAWLGLPPVEVLPAIDIPDAWFLPAVKGRLHLAISQETGKAESDKAAETVKRPAHIELLVNMTPSERWAGSQGNLRRNMSGVIPALKVLSGLSVQSRPPSAAVFDLTRHRVGYETDNAATLDWSALSKLLTESNPGIIDAKSLAGQSSMREYFAREVARRAGSSGPPRWIIVLSGPLVLSKQEETPLPELPPDTNRHLVYLRFAPGFGASAFGNGPPGGAYGAAGPDVQIAPPRRVRGPMPGLGSVLPGGPGRGRGEMEAIFPDDLERVLKPMGAQIVGVATPEAFRKTIASLIAGISAN